MGLVHSQGVTDELVVRSLERNLAIIRFDLDRRVAYVNEVFANSMGYKKDEMYGMHHKEFCFPHFADSPGYERFWQDLLQGRVFRIRSNEWIRKEMRFGLKPPTCQCLMKAMNKSSEYLK